MGNWEFIKAEETKNLFSDPSFALADPDTEWALYGDGAVDFTREVGSGYFGFSCAKAALGGGTFARITQTFTVTATSHTLSVLVRRDGGGVVSDSECKAQFDSSSYSWDSITAMRDGWYLCVKTATATAGSRIFGGRCLEEGLLVDGMQLENLDHRTTFCDGEQPGCKWLGSQFASQSERDEQSRDGGRVYDFEDYGATVEAFAGTGVPPLYHAAPEYTQLPGSEFKRTKIRDRTILLTLWMAGTSVATLHALRQALIQAIGPEEPTGQQSFILRYSGADVPRQIKVRYEAGLESGKWQGFQESVGLRLWAEDPMWYAEGDGQEEIDSNDTKAFKPVYGRVDGAWSDMGPPSASGAVHALAWGPDRCLYIGGDFTNWDGIAAADYIVKWDPEAAAYSALGTGMAGGIVYALAFAPNGDLYAGGAFTGAGGVANTDQIARWDGSAWNSVGGGATNGTVYALAVDANGQPWAGGAFTSIGGDAVNGVAFWDGTDWQNTYSTGADDTVFALALHPNGNIFAGGDFATIGGRTAARVAVWDGDRWAALSDGCNDTVKSLVVAGDGTLYIGGEFTSPASKVVSWNGTSYVAMTDYFNDDEVNSLVIGPDGVLHAAGKGGGDLPVPAPATKWWDPNDSDLPVWGAWRAEDADDYEYSKTDLSGNGHHLVEEGGAMPWDTVNGWEVESWIKRALLTGFVPDKGADQTFLIQVTSLHANVHCYPMGSMNKDNDRFAVNTHSGKGITYWNGGKLYIAGGVTNVNLGVTADDGYEDGVKEAGTCASWSSSPGPMPQVALGALLASFGMVTGGSMYIQAAVIYDGEISAAEMAAVEAQMSGGWDAPAAPTSDSVYVVAKWDGTQWVLVDSVAPSEPYALAVGRERLVGYDLYVGAAGASTEQIAGITTVTHDGTAQAYPIITFKRTGGDGATVVSLSNETTGKALAFAYAIKDGEVVTVDLERKRITSDCDGNVLDSMLASSAFGAFALMPGENRIACFVETDGAPTVEARMTWRIASLSVD